MAYIQIEGTPDSLVPPYNKEKVAELLTAALTGAGFNPPECIPDEIGDENRQLGVQVLEGVYDAQQITQIVAILDAVAADPTRNDLTEEEQEQADLQAKIDNMVADIGAILDPGGLHEQLLANVDWNALTTDQQADVLRGVMRASGIDYHDIVLDLLRAVRYLLRTEKKRQTGVFSLTAKSE